MPQLLAVLQVPAAMVSLRLFPEHLLLMRAAVEEGHTPGPLAQLVEVEEPAAVEPVAVVKIHTLPLLELPIQEVEVGVVAT
jgi:hypothetical protein